MTSTYWPDIDKVECAFNGSLAVSMHNLMWLDADDLLGNGVKAYPGSSLTNQGSESANQAYFGPRFVGVAAEAMSSGQTRETILVDRVYIGPMTIASGTYYQGDLVACTDSASSTPENAKIKKTTTAADAIGFIMQNSVAGATTVTVCLISRVLPTYTLPLQVLNTAGITLDDGANIAANTTTGSEIATAVGQKLGFWGTTPVVQPSGADQAAVALTTSAAVATNAATASSPYGYDSNTQADALVANVNSLYVDVQALNTLVNQLRSDLVTIGIIKGSA